MSDVLIATDSSGLERHRNDYLLMRGWLQDIVTQYYGVIGVDATNPGFDFVGLNTDDFRQLITDPNTFVATKLFGGVYAAGIPLNPVVMVATGLVAKPAGYDELIAAVAKFKTDIVYREHVNGATGMYMSYSWAGIIKSFEIDIHWRVAITVSADAALTLQYQSYAKSTTAKNALTLANTILSELESLGLTDVATHYNQGFGGFMEALLHRESQLAPLTLNKKGILSFNNR